MQQKINHQKCSQKYVKKTESKKNTKTTFLSISFIFIMPIFIPRIKRAASLKTFQLGVPIYNSFIHHTSQNSFNKWTKISSLEINIFDLKMMVKSGLEFFILKFYQPLQRYLLTCQANSALLGRSFCTGQQQL